MQIQTTTALRKISNLKKRIWGIQGGQGAGKTFSILQILINHALSHNDKEIYIASDELSKMRITVIKDFIKIMKAFGVFERENWKDGVQYQFNSVSFIRFIGLDKEDIGKGLRSDVIFINEANKVKFETYRELTSRAKRIIIDFNPNAEFWYHKEIMTRSDCEHLILTFKDNEYLDKNERNEILSYYEKGYNTDGSIKNQYWANKWQVYGLGVIGSVEGRIFFWNKISENVFESINAKSIICVDWGTSDPFAVIEIKYQDGKLFAKELNYNSENEWRKRLTNTEKIQIEANEEGLVTWLFNRLKIEKNKVIVCDNNRPTKIVSLRRSGWEYSVAIRKVQNSIIDGIDILQNLDVYYTENSIDIENEQKLYSWDKDKNGNQLENPIDMNNHTIDAIRYGALYLIEQGIIKRI